MFVLWKLIIPMVDEDSLDESKLWEELLGRQFFLWLLKHYNCDAHHRPCPSSARAAVTETLLLKC